MKTLFMLGGHGDIGKAIVAKFAESNYKTIVPTSQELNLENIDAIDVYFKNRTFAIDVLITSAGWNEPKPIEEITFADINKTIGINVLGFCRVVQHLLPFLKEKESGYILAISSIFSFITRGKRLAYTISKHALNGLVKTLAIELGPSNIKVNALSPGYVDTKMTRKNNDSETIRKLAEGIPLGRLASSDDIAAVAYFLCSEQNQYISGQNIVVDGGYSIGGFQK